MGRSKRMTRRRKSYQGGMSPFLQSINKNPDTTAVMAGVEFDVTNFVRNTLVSEFHQFPKSQEDEHLTVDEYVGKYFRRVYDTFYPRLYRGYLRARGGHLVVPKTNESKFNRVRGS
jgi:hypothetical protein